MTVGEHLEELRRRLIFALLGLAAGVVVSLVAGGWILQQLKIPYNRVMERLGEPAQLRVLHASAGFLTYMKVALVSGLILTSPWVFYQLWAFVAKGLYARERRAVLFVVPISAGLFVGGAMFFLYVVAVPVLTFFLGFNARLGLSNDLTLPNHISMMLSMMLVFGLAFELPLVVAVLGWLGLVTPKDLTMYRRHVIVGLFILAALMTSPSPVDQVLLALPMWLLYEFGILLVRCTVRRHPTDEQDGEFPAE